MGLYNGSLANYYGGLETLGGYQFISITDVINNFRVGYVGEDKIIPKISRADIKFHALRGLQELTYDTFRSCKTLELEVPPYLQLPLPHDYVNYVKISWVDSNGKCHTIRQCNTCPKDPLSYRQHDSDGDGDKENWVEGDIDVGESTLETVDHTVLISEAYGEGWDPVIISTSGTEAYGEGWNPIVIGMNGEEKIYSTDISDPRNWDIWHEATLQNVYSSDLSDPRNWGTWHDAVYDTVTTTTGSYEYNPVTEDSTTWSNLSGSGTSADSSESYSYQDNMGKRYGLDPQHANVNGCFWINCRNGKIYFDSNLAGKTVTIQYISDSAATDDEMLVHKFAEEAMYKHIAHAILNTRANTDRNIVSTYKKERFAAIRNAKLRLSSIKLEEITQILRGKSKWIKH